MADPILEALKQGDVLSRLAWLEEQVKASKPAPKPAPTRKPATR